MWSKLDWKRGRWNINAETTLIHRGLRGWQRGVGDSVTYWRFDYAASQMHPIYDEGDGVGRQFYGPWQLPVLHANHFEAANTEPREAGLYIVDTLHVTAEFRQVQKTGLTLMDIHHGCYQRDRIAYDNILYQVQHMNILGQIRRRDIVVTFDCQQVKNDEIVNDPEFAPYMRDTCQLPPTNSVFQNPSQNPGGQL